MKHHSTNGSSKLQSTIHRQSQHPRRRYPDFHSDIKPGYLCVNQSHLGFVKDVSVEAVQSVGTQRGQKTIYPKWNCIHSEELRHFSEHHFSKGDTSCYQEPIQHRPCWGKRGTFSNKTVLRCVGTGTWAGADVSQDDMKIKDILRGCCQKWEGRGCVLNHTDQISSFIVF